MTGRVIQRMDHIATQEQRDGRLVLANRSGNEIGDGPDGLPLPPSISGVDNNNKDAGKNDAHAEPNDRTYKACKYRNYRADGTLNDVE